MQSYAPAMRDLLMHRGEFRSAHHDEPGVLVGHVALNRGDERLNLAGDEERIVAFDGVIYEWKSPNRKESGISQELLRLIGEQGLGIISRLNGSFVGAIWEKKYRRLVLFNDRYGLRPLYYSYSPGIGFAFAAEAKALSPVPWVSLRPSEQGIVEFLTFRQLLDDRTLFEGIRLFPPGAIGVWEDDKFRIERYWEYEPKPRPIGLEEAALGFRDTMHRAVQRQLGTQSPAGLLLSGGIDSRAILGSAIRVVQGLRTYTYGLPPCTDLDLASRVAERARTRHREIRQDPAFLARVAEEGVWLTEGMLPCERLQAMDAWPVIYQDETEVLLSGAAGELLTGCYLAPEAVRLPRSTPRDVLARFSRPKPISRAELQRLLVPRLCARYSDYADVALDHIFRRYDGEWAPHEILEHFQWYQFYRRIVLVGGKPASLYFDQRFPFCDYDLMDFLLSLPPDVKMRQRFYKLSVAMSNPELAEIPTPRHGLPIGEPPWYARFARAVNPTRNPRFWDGLNRARYYFRKIGLGSIPWPRPVPSSGADYPELYRGPLRDYLRKFLAAPDARYPEYVRRDEVIRMLEEHLEYKHDYHSWKLGLILTLELWLRRFVP